MLCSRGMLFLRAYIAIPEIITPSPNNHPRLLGGMLTERKLPIITNTIAVSKSVFASLRLVFLFFLYICVAVVDANTSRASAIPIAWYGGTPKNTIIIGAAKITALALSKPVIIPAPKPAMRSVMNSYT